MTPPPSSLLFTHFSPSVSPLSLPPCPWLEDAYQNTLSPSPSLSPPLSPSLPLTWLWFSERGMFEFTCVLVCEYLCVCTLSKRDIGADIWEINMRISLCLTLYTQTHSPPLLGEGEEWEREKEKGVLGSVNDDWPLGLDSESSLD